QHLAGWFQVCAQPPRQGEARFARGDCPTRLQEWIVMTKRCFIDTETTSLRPDRRAWEVGIIVREERLLVHPTGPDVIGVEEREYQFFVDHRDLDLGNAD